MFKLPECPELLLSGISIGLQKFSNERVTASVRGDTEIPTDGAFGLLPSKMQESMKLEGLVSREKVTNVGRGANAGQFDQATLHRVPENQAVARIVAAADPSVKAGSSLDERLLEVGRTYLDAQVQQEQAGGAKGGIPDHSPLIVEGMEPGTTRVTEDIFAAVAPDKIAIDGAFNDPKHGQDFVRDLMTHNWPDDNAARGLFHFNDGDQYVTAGEGHTGQVVAERSGNIMEAVARAMSGDEARDLMMNIPGTDHKTMSAGELNPNLLQEISRSMAPYIPEMAYGGNPPDLQTAGFDVPMTSGGDPSNWLNPDNRYHGLSNIFTVMGTDGSDGGAGQIFRAAADHAILAQQGMYAADPHAAGAVGHLYAAGTIQGAMDQGLINTLQDGNNDAKVSAEDAYKAKEKAFNMVSKLADFGIGKLPGGSYVNMMLGLGGDQKELFIGSPPPQDAQIAHAPAPNFDARTAQVIQAVPRELIPQHFRDIDDYDWMFDDNGNVVDYKTALQQAHRMGAPLSDVPAGYLEVLESFGNHGQGTAFQSKYNGVVLQPVAGTQPQ